ncbi:MAG: PKD domain-containing protein, partial [Bacteroidota bacterium]
GSIGTTLTHEMGHWLGLYHPFLNGGNFSGQQYCQGQASSNCATSGDRVCDTQQGNDSYLDCSDRNSCDDGPCDYLDQKELYMGYASCVSSFTLGQAERMYFYLDNQLASLWSPANLTATGIDNVSPIYSEPAATFSVSQTTACPGSTISFTDETLGCVETYNWIFPGGNPVSSSNPNPEVTYALPGEYPVQLTVSNGGGYTNSVTRTSYIKIADVGVQLPYSESFETGTFAPAGWKIVDEMEDGGWERKTLISSDGVACASFPAFNSQSCDSRDDMITPLLDLTNIYTASMKFDYAYAAFSASQDEADQLLVQVMDECGNLLPSALFEGSGFSLTSNQQFLQQEFTPDASDWKTLDISLNDYVGQKVYVVFNFYSLQGQNFYLDNVVIDGFTTGIEPLHDLAAASSVVPNPFEAGFMLQFQIPQSEDMRLEVVDLSGKTLYTQTLGRLSAGTHEYELGDPAITNLSAGVYFLNLYTERGRATKKLVKL